MPEILIVNNAEYADRDFIAPLRGAITELCDGVKPGEISYLEAPDQIDRLSEADAIIGSGTPLRYAYKTAERRASYIGWVPEVDTKILGICAFFQTLGVLEGVKVMRGVEPETGLCELEIIDDHAVVEGINTGDLVPSYHRASIPVPLGYEHIARTLAGPNSATGCEAQVIVGYNGRVVGSQFHPESIPGEMRSEAGMLFLANFLAYQPVKKLIRVEPIIVPDASTIESIMSTIERV